MGEIERVGIWAGGLWKGPGRSWRRGSNDQNMLIHFQQKQSKKYVFRVKFNRQTKLPFLYIDIIWVGENSPQISNNNENASQVQEYKGAFKNEVVGHWKKKRRKVMFFRYSNKLFVV